MKAKNILAAAVVAAMIIPAACSKHDPEPEPLPEPETPSLAEWHPEPVPENEIHYLSITGEAVYPEEPDDFGDVDFVSSTYENGMGIMKFSGKLTEIGGIRTLRSTEFTAIKLPASVTFIGHYAFADNLLLEQFTVGPNVTTIQNNPFECCDGLKCFFGRYVSEDKRCIVVDGELKSFAPAGLTSYSVPNGVKRIGDSAFKRCLELEELTLPASVDFIATAAFLNCRGLKKLTMLGEVSEIGYIAFEYNHSLEEIYCKSAVPPAFEYNIAPSRSDVPALKAVYVPRGSVDAYKSKWAFVADLIEGYDF